MVLHWLLASSPSVHWQMLVSLVTMTIMTSAYMCLLLSGFYQFNCVLRQRFLFLLLDLVYIDLTPHWPWCLLIFQELNLFLLLWPQIWHLFVFSAFLHLLCAQFEECILLYNSLCLFCCQHISQILHVSYVFSSGIHICLVSRFLVCWNPPFSPQFLFKKFFVIF